MFSLFQRASAQKVAEFFIWKSNEQGKGITNKKLQKLVYYSQVWSLVVFGHKLFNDRIEAWIHGPAIPSLYARYKRFEFGNIKIAEVQAPSFSQEQLGLLNNIWSVYGKYDAEYLEALTHSELPWQTAREGLAPHEPSKKEIDLNFAKQYYAAKRSGA